MIDPTALRRLPRALVLAQAAACAACLAAYAATGLSIAWTTIPSTIPLMAVALGVWAVTRRRAEVDGWLALAILLSFSTTALLIQYPLVTLGRPLIDDALMRADAALGFSSARMVGWTMGHPAAREWLLSAYATLGVQILIALAIVCARRDRGTLWEFVFHYHVTLGLSLLACALWPANEPWFHAQLPDIANQGLAASQIADLHRGAMTVVDASHLEGLVSMPSFHVAAAWLATWTLRGCRPALAVFIPLNVLLTASTFLLGIHYVVDAAAGLALLGASVLIYRIDFAGVFRLEASAPLAADSSRALVAE